RGTRCRDVTVVGRTGAGGAEGVRKVVPTAEGIRQGVRSPSSSGWTMSNRRADLLVPPARPHCLGTAFQPVRGTDRRDGAILHNTRSGPGRRGPTTRAG